MFYIYAHKSLVKGMPLFKNVETQLPIFLHQCCWVKKKKKDWQKNPKKQLSEKKKLTKTQIKIKKT